MFIYNNVCTLMILSFMYNMIRSDIIFYAKVVCVTNIYDYSTY